MENENDKISHLPAELHIEILTRILLNHFSDLLGSKISIFRTKSSERGLFGQVKVALESYLTVCQVARQYWHGNRLFILRCVNNAVIQPSLENLRRKAVRTRLRYLMWAAISRWKLLRNAMSILRFLNWEFVKTRSNYSHWLRESKVLLKELSAGESYSSGKQQWLQGIIWKRDVNSCTRTCN
jgi:hypothetical protein